MSARMALAFIFSLVLVSQTSHDYPTKPVRLIEPFGAGGGPDVVGRALAQKLTELWGQPVTVEKVPGAGATAGPAQVAKSPADGYTLLVNTSAGRVGETSVETMSAILREDPPDLTATNQIVPPVLERMVRRCLEKNPEERFQSARDVAFALGNLSGSSGTNTLGAGAEPKRRFPLHRWGSFVQGEQSSRLIATACLVS